jgi:osmotically inducible lipoprotein OsmE
MKTCFVAGLVCLLTAVAGCSTVKDPDPKEVMSRVRIGMTNDDVVDRLGPADASWGPEYARCLEYTFGKQGADRYAIYFNNQRRVTYSEHAECKLKRAQRLGLR